MKLVIIKVFERPMIKSKNIAEFRNPIHSIKYLIKEKFWNLESNWPKKKTIKGP